ncbi:chemotaxis protein CheW [Gammaproteobacteria bacterium]
MDSRDSERRQEGAGASVGQYLSFTLGGEDFGVDILKVQEIRGWETVRHLPDAPDFLKGVLDLRGTIVPIIDMRTRFHFARADYTPTTVVIVLVVAQGENRQIVGAVVDGVSDVLEVTGQQLKPAPNLGSKINRRYILGMLSNHQRMVVLLDVDKLFSPEELDLFEDLA